MNQELNKLFEIRDIDNKYLITKKDNVITHLLYRLVIPFFVFYSFWHIIDKYCSLGGLEKMLLSTTIFSVLLFIINVLLFSETKTFHKHKKIRLRNINCILLMLFIPAFLFQVYVSFAVFNF